MFTLTGAGHVRRTGKEKVMRVFPRGTRLWGSLCVAFCVLLNVNSQVQAQAQASLDAKDWRVRAAFIAKIDVASGAIDANLRTKLVELLGRENEVVKSTLERTGGKEGISVSLGEGYSEYYSRLSAVILGIAKSGDETATRILASSAFNDDSETASLLVEKWNISLPVFMQELTATAAQRAQSLGMIGRIVKSEAINIPPNQLSSIKAAFQRGLADQDPGVRVAAVHSTIDANFVELVPTLQALARQDPARHRVAGKVSYPVREAAARATQALTQQ
jgi:hypothetical protein